MQPLTKIICGDIDGLGELSDVLEQLAGTLDEMGPRCYEYIIGNNPQDACTFGPYCGRLVLEAACSALIGRLDPLRILVVKRCQEHENYNIAARHKISIQWAGDITSEKAPQNLWESVNGSKEIIRSLLAGHMGEVFWRAGFEKLLDDSAGDKSEWIRELKLISPDGVVSYFRTEADRLYSSLSKGIHHEFVVPRNKIYDLPTVVDLLQRTIILVAKLGFVSNYIPMNNANRSIQDLIECLLAVEDSARVQHD